MANEPTIRAVLHIWPELPALAGEYWSDIEEQLKRLIAAFEAATDSNEQARICIEIQDTLETVPELNDRFDVELQQISQSNGAQTTKSISSQIQRILGRTDLPNKSFTRYTDISCPRRVWIQTQRISVVVRLNLQPSALSDAHEELLINKETPVLVQINAPGFEVLGPGAQEVIVRSETDSAPLVFDLAPRQIGYTSVFFDFIQAGNPIGTASLLVEITKEEVSMRDQPYAGTELHATENVNAPDFILYITYEPLSSPDKLHFELFQKGRVFRQKFDPSDLTVTPQAYAKEIYRRLTDLMSNIDPATHALQGIKSALAPRRVDDHLQEEGQNLWNDLIPREFRERYTREYAQWQNKTLLIISDEPHIPWELLWPYGPEIPKDAGPLCLQMKLSRWLRRSSQGKALYEPKPVLHMQEMAVIVPRDTQLPAAQRERSFMRALIKQYGLKDVSPPEPTYNAVKQLLQDGSYDWFHVATHGNFYPSDPDGESAIWLMDQQPLTARSIVGEVEYYLRDHRPAFVFNACEAGRLGWAITGLGGWASRLIGSGAGLFLAPLWEVDDNTAATFSTAVYQALLEGQTAADAVQQARLKVRTPGDPTWLAYSLYAHPNAVRGMQ